MVIRFLLYDKSLNSKAKRELLVSKYLPLCISGKWEDSIGSTMPTDSSLEPLSLVAVKLSRGSWTTFHPPTLEEMFVLVVEALFTFLKISLQMR